MESLVSAADVNAGEDAMTRNGDGTDTIAAIVVTYNSSSCIIPCLEALEREIADCGGDILVFDNNSSDDTTKRIKAAMPEMRVYESPRNLGFAEANNKALDMIDGRYVLFVNPDTVMDEGSLRQLLKAIKETDDAGAVVGRMRNPDGSFQPTCRKVPNTRNIFFSRGSVLSKLGIPARNGNTYTLGDFATKTEVPAAAATCMLVERELFEQIGGFDNRFFLFAEDIDLSIRIRQNQRKVYFVPEAGALHLWGEGANVSPVRRSWHHHVAVWKFFMKHYPNGFSLLVLPAALFVNFTIRAFTGLDSK
ncbi:MAG: glycosyltransferase family 2 protein [candidate division Zixibacteria bacterium]|nr:glycosyltransferase family 2 protein [candidate division Zixibacteria bacterium]